MTLLVDIGNTNIVIGIAVSLPEIRIVRSWRMRTDAQRTSDEYELMLRGFLRDASVDTAGLNRCGLSSVVPVLTDKIAGVITAVTGCIPVVVDSHVYSRLPVIIPHDAAGEIGADIVCNSVAAYTRFHSACVVVDFGTAMTFTAIGSAGNICGAAIAPGLGTAVNALFQNAAQLPSVPIEAPPSSLGMNSVSAIQAGVVLGYAGLVESLVERMKRDMISQGQGDEHCHFVATGGFSSVMDQITPVFDCIDINLTLNGLCLITEL